MISNTVIVFLRDLLPIFILFSYLSVLSPSLKPNNALMSFCFLLGGSFTILFYSFIEKIGQSLNGAGLEVFYVILLATTYITLSLGTILPIKMLPKKIVQSLIITGISTFITFKSTQFLLYFGVYGRNLDSLYEIVMGCILGLGICISFSTLLKFVLSELYESTARFFCYILWFAFLSGHLAHSIRYLSQVDIMSLGPPIINLDFIMQDSSEYGHVLHALIGYESSPSMTFLICYGIAFITPIFTLSLFNKEKINTNFVGDGS